LAAGFAACEGCEGADEPQIEAEFEEEDWKGSWEVVVDED